MSLNPFTNCSRRSCPFEAQTPELLPVKTEKAAACYVTRCGGLKVGDLAISNFNPFLRCINDCPTCEFQPLTPDRWLANLKGVKKNSARGADGFSTFELQLVHGPLLHFLLDILSTIEKGAKWPDLRTQARVVVLSKGFEPKSPLDIRPIAILPKIYRTWSRLRSLEVLRHIGSILPPQVAATAGGISADSLAAYTATVVEDAFWNRKISVGW